MAASLGVEALATGPPPSRDDVGERRDNTEMDRIVLRGMVFHGRHGVSDAERAREQPFTVDVELEADLSRAGASDRIEDTIDYRRLHAIAKAVIEGASAHLVEALAERIADRALELPGATAVSVRVAKVPPRMQPIESASVIVARSRP